MSSRKFTIPPEYLSELCYAQLQDTRTDEEILSSLSQYDPVTSEKNIWAFWDKGLSAQPSWTQRNVCDWVRICSTGTKPWTVRVLDAIPDSPTYALNFISPDLLPQAFVDRSMTGPYIGPHSADFLRGALLYTHGGVFMDVGNILIRHLDLIGWNELEDLQSPYNICVPIMYGQVIANNFVMARRGDQFIKRWHDLFTHLWRDGRQSSKGIAADPLLAFMASMNRSFENSKASNFHWKFKIEAGEVFDEQDSFNGSEYWHKHVLCFDALQEIWGTEATIGFDGEDAYKALYTRLDADSESAEYKKAYGLVWRLLTKSSFQKITHGKGLTHDTHLGVFWDENEGKDREPGTFAELLRYGCTRFEQTRENVVRVDATPAKETMKKAALEP